MHYEDRLLRVLTYIYEHPDGDLSLDNLADVAVSLAPRVSCDDRGNLRAGRAADAPAPGSGAFGA